MLCASRDPFYSTRTEWFIWEQAAQFHGVHVIRTGSKKDPYKCEGNTGERIENSYPIGTPWIDGVGTNQFQREANMKRSHGFFAALVAGSMLALSLPGGRRRAQFKVDAVLAKTASQQLDHWTDRRHDCGRAGSYLGLPAPAFAQKMWIAPRPKRAKCCQARRPR